MATQPDFEDDDFQEDAPELDLDAGDGGEDQDADAPEPEADAPDTDEDQITFGGGAIAGEEETEGMRNLRNRLRERERELRDLKGQPKTEEIGEKPNLDDYWDKPDDYDRDLLAWNERQRTADQRREQSEAAARKQQERWEAQHRDLDTGYGDLRVSGKDAARAKVEEAFPGEQFAYLVKAAGKNAPGFVYALGNSVEKQNELKALAEDGSWAEFIATAAVMAKEVNVQRRRPATEPEQVHRGQSGGKGDSKRDRLMADGMKSGDYTALVAYDTRREKN